MTRINPAITDRVMEEIEKLRGSLTQALELTEVNTCGGPDVAQLIADMRAAISQQDQPTDTYTAVDMATAAAQGFRDGQAAVEHQSLNEWFLSLEPGRQAVRREDKWMLANAAFEAGCATRHAQTEQQPEQSGLLEALDWLDTEVSAIDTWYRGSPSYEHGAGWFKDEVLRLIEGRRAALSAVTAERDQLRAEVDALRKDAERYRWLRDPCSGAEHVIYYSRGDYGRGLMSGSMLDAAIDAALAAK
jgi:hypothetical protein